jgi:glycosyltransferase involved in cell wall biosynthesis
VSETLRIALVSRRIVRTEGQGRVNAEIIKRGVERGIRFTLVAEAVSPELLELPGVMWVPIATTFAPTQLLRNMIFSVATTRWLRRNRRNFDIVHVDGFATFGKSDINVVHYVHSEWLRAPVLWDEAFKSARGFYHVIYTLANAWLERGAFRRTRSVVAVSTTVGAELVRLGVRAQTVHVIPNGCDTPVPAPLPIDRAALGIPADCFLLLFAGDLQTARKNLDTLLEALVLVPGVHLAVAGELRSRRYPAKCEALGLSDRVHFISFRKDDLPEVMATADAFVMASFYEPFGLVILEAMAAGTAVITSRTVGASSLVGDAGTVLADAKDPVALAGVIRHLAAHPDTAVRMGAAGREIALGRTWQRMADSYIDIYRTIAAGA